MRLALCTIRDLTGSMILNALLPRLRGHEVHLFLANRRRPVDTSTRTLAELWFLERTLPVDTMFPMIEAANLPRRGRRLTFRELSEDYDAPLTVLSTVEEWNGGQPLLDASPDLMVSSRFSFLLAEDVIKSVPGGCHNLHPSALPRHPGQFPVLRAMTSDDGEIGCTLHEITPGIDDGAVVGRAAIRRRTDRSHFWHRWAAYRAGVDRIVEAIDAAAAGTPRKGVPQEGRAEKPGAWPKEDEFVAAQSNGITITGGPEILSCVATYAPGLFPLPEEPNLPDWSDAEIGFL